MFVRFCLYSVFKNLRFFEPFFVLYLLAPVDRGGAQLSYLAIGTLVGYQKLLTGILEIPLGVATDRFGRRSALVLCFGLYTLAFPCFALASQLHGAALHGMLYLAQTLFGIGEALRTGSHKAIMLDWASREGEPMEVTRLIARTRFFSKLSAGLAALAGGFVVWRMASFTPLFLAATVPAFLGVVLMLSYPSWLEGEQRRDGATRLPLRKGLHRMLSQQGLWPVFVTSLLFESQVKLAQHYLQPFLAADLKARDLALVGGIGALVVGAFYLLQGVVGAVAARLSSNAEEGLGGVSKGLSWVYFMLLAASGLMALAFSLGWLSLGLLGFFVVAALQNLRRPIFVSGLDRVMDPAQRATTLSLESQARSWSLALLSPPVGYLADRLGIAAAFVAITLLLAVGLPFHLRRFTQKLDATG
jgi:MFS family permease